MRLGAVLADRLGLAIGDLALLEQALVHGSHLHEHPEAASGHNERLEFLGDAVVSLAVSEALYRRHATDNEGILSARRAAIVSTAGLAALAARLRLGELILLGEGEDQRGGRTRPSVLASAFEAVVGAVFLDLGYPRTRRWLIRFIGPDLAQQPSPGQLKSPKSRLQEHTQRLNRERPEYRVVSLTGPDHERIYVVEAVIGGRAVASGSGTSRREAETTAAERALAVLEEEGAARPDVSGGSPQPARDG